MGDKTSIEWTATINADGSVTPGATWNPTVGCDRISPGCAHCYAKTLHDKRHKAVLAGKNLAPQYAQPFETLQLMEDRLDAPLHWRRPRRVFVNSVSDLFHQDVPDAFIDRVFAVMALAPQHTFQILTKRAERMRDYMRTPPPAVELSRLRDRHERPADWRWPLRNVWLGVSVENQRFADERIPLLLQTPAAVRFISAEPLLGPVDLNDLGDCIDALDDTDAQLGTPFLNWVIVGGESGAGARPFDIAWARSIVYQCQAAGVPVFMKQIGHRPLDNGGRPLLRSPGGSWHFKDHPRDSHGGDPAEWPEEIRVRQFPGGQP